MREGGKRQMGQMDYMDLLSRLGVASAHPGGFKATRRVLERSLPSGGLHILEVGCGTGKTACHLAQSGHRVTALDQHPLMLEKAKQRALREGIADVQWAQGSTHALPFEEATFDVVFAESVTVFTDVKQSLQEYYRVMKPQGRLLDRELVLHAPMPEPIYAEIKSYFKLKSILSLDEWMELLRQVGFVCERPEAEPFWSQEHAAEEGDLQELDVAALMDPDVGEGILKYADLMLAQEQYFRACNFVALKI